MIFRPFYTFLDTWETHTLFVYNLYV